MDYSYLQPHDRQEGRPAPENGRGHPQNQYPVHSEHQQYPTGHQVMSTGYPSHGYASYIHPIQAPITSSNAGIPSQEGLHPPRMMVQDSSRSSSSSSAGMPFRTDSQQSTHLQHILHAVAHQPHMMQSDAAFPANLSSIVQSDPSRTSSGHSSSTASSGHHGGRRGQPIETVTCPPLPDEGFNMNRPIVTQPVVSPNAPPQTSVQLASSHAAVKVSNQISSVDHQERVNRPSIELPLQDKTSRASVLKPLGQVPESRLEHVSGPPAASSVSSSQRPLGTSSDINNKSCQTEPLFDMLPVAARTLSSSFDLLEGFSYKMTGEDTSPGVVVTKDVQEGDEFGPFTGEFVEDEHGIIDPMSWEVCVRGKPGLYISGTCDPNNWMTHVQVARCREEQNMEAFQFYGDIFFRTTKAIEAGTELRVFYSKDYCRKVGLGTGLEELPFDQDLGRFKCSSCEGHYSNAKSLLRHIKFEHDKENVPVAQLARTEQHPSRKDKAGQSGRPILKVKQDRSVSLMRNTSKDSTRKGEKRKKTKSSDVSKRIRVKFIPPKMKKSSVTIKKMEDVHKELKASRRSCNVCGMLCKNVKMLKQHEISHIPDAFQCHLCQRYFRWRRHMVYHLRHDHDMFGGKKWSEGDVDDLLSKIRVAGDQQDVQEDEEKKLKPVVNKKKKRLSCVECNQSFVDKKTFEQHECTQVTFKCKYCDKVFQKNTDRVAHLRQEHKIFIWKQHSFKMEERLQRYVHPVAQTEEPSFHPDLPRDMFGRKIALPVKNAKVFKCKYCPKTYTQFFACSRHERQTHTFSGNFMCEFCSASFVNETTYLVHKTKHTKERLYKCTECPLSYSSQGALERHVRDHRGELPHKCDICSKGYRTRKHMMAHKRGTHEPPKVMFQCQFCPKKLKNKVTHKAHENCHKGVRPYMCFTCSKGFRDSYSLKRHMLTHTGEKPHECKLCQKRFRVPHQLFQHMIVHRKDERYQADKESDGPSTCTSNQTIPRVDPSTSMVND